MTTKAQTGNGWERLVNVAIGLTLIQIVIVDFLLADPEKRLAPVRLATAGVAVYLGCLFIARRQSLKHGDVAAILFSLPGVLVPAIATRVAHDPQGWTMGPKVLFIAASIALIITFTYLGRSFAILPAVRKLVVHGPYRLVRHPAYAIELTMIAACVWAQPGWIIATVFIASIALLVLRIHHEERILRTDPAYREYARRVRYRLVPGLW